MKRKPIDSKLLKVWREKMFDITQDDVQNGTGLSKPTIKTALRDGKATQETIDLLTTYFQSLITAHV